MNKKVVLLILVFSLACSSSLSAEVFLGAKKGINLAFQSSYDPGSLVSGFKIGFSGGLLAAIPLTRALVVQPEILFSQKGRAVYSPDRAAHIYLTYIDFPMILKFGLLHAPIVWSFYSGAQVSVALGGNTNLEESNETVPFTKEALNDIDAAVIIGTDVGLPIGRSRIFLDFRYALGITTALKHEKARNQVLSFYLGYGFTL